MDAADFPSRAGEKKMKRAWERTVLGALKFRLESRIESGKFELKKKGRRWRPKGGGRVAHYKKSVSIQKPNEG